MSENQAAWVLICGRFSQGLDPFEIEEIVPDLAGSLMVSEAEAKSTIEFLLSELERLPAGRSFFEREGNAVVPLPEFLTLVNRPGSFLDAYPYEL